jgi:hypothetical protein
VGFAGVQAALAVEGVAAGPLAGSRKLAGSPPGVHFQILSAAVSLKIRKPSFDQAGPSVKEEAFADNLDGNLGKILRGRESRENRGGRYRFGGRGAI